MKKYLLTSIMFFVVLFCNAQKLPDYDPYNRWVTDLGGLYTPEQKAQLSSILSNYEKQTSVEIAVLTVCDFESSIEDFSQKTATKWGVGKKDINNGMLIVISKCKHVFRVEVGYGLEGYTPDGWIKLKQMDVKNNFFQYGKYYEGTVALVDSVTTKIGKEYSQDHNNKLIKASKKSSDDDYSWIFKLLKKIPWWIWPIIVGAWVVLLIINPELAMDVLWLLFWLLTLGRAGGGGSGSFGGGKFGGGGSSD